MTNSQSDRLKNYMEAPSMGLGWTYIHTRASSLHRYFLERGIHLIFSKIPGPLGIVLRAAAYKPFFQSYSNTAFIESSTDLFYMNTIKCKKGVYIDKLCRIHASAASIELGENNRIMTGAYLCSYVSNANTGEGIITGSDCWIGINAVLASGQGGIFIGNNVLIGRNAAIVTGNHDFQRTDVPTTEQNYYGKPININDNVWVGANATLLGGVSVGEHSVIAAGSVVTEDVPAYTVAGGVPARKLSEIKN